MRTELHNCPCMRRTAASGRRRMKGTSQAGRMTPGIGAFFEQHQLGMKVIRQRDHEKKQHHGADECRPFTPGSVAPQASLPHPPGAPHRHPGQSDQDPQNVEEQFHFSECLVHNAKIRPSQNAQRPKPQSIYYAKGVPSNRRLRVYLGLNRGTHHGVGCSSVPTRRSAMALAAVEHGQETHLHRQDSASYLERSLGSRRPYRRIL